MPEQQSASESVCRVFVYGTLKRGQCREACWPARPLMVQAAEVRGLLYDLGPFPALRQGDGRVSGEVWEFADEDMARVLKVIDAIEGFADTPTDLYRRVQIIATVEGIESRAWTYVFGTTPPRAKRIDADPARWPVHAAPRSSDRGGDILAS